MSLSAVCTTLCRHWQATAVVPPYHTVMPLLRMLLVMQLQTFLRFFGDVQNFLSLLMTSWVLLSVQVKSVLM